MFRRDPITVALAEAAELLGVNLNPKSSALSISKLARQAFYQGGVLGISAGGQQLIWGFKGVPTTGIFEIASLTKPFTAALASALVAHGLVVWDQPLSRLAGPFLRLPPHITALSLSTHTAGLPMHPARAALTTITHFSNPYVNMTVSDVVASAKRWSRKTLAPQFAYSNLGFGLLALALAYAAGQAPTPQGYLHALGEYILGPLGLELLGLELVGLNGSLTPNSKVITPKNSLSGAAFTDFGGLTGAGGLFANALNLLSFAEAHLKGQAGKHWQTLLTTGMVKGLPPHVDGIAAGWFATNAKVQSPHEHGLHGHGPLRWHDGVARGTRTALGFDAGRGTAVVILARGGLSLLTPVVPNPVVPTLLQHLLRA